MVDIVTAEKRSKMMAGIRGKNTRGEILVRKCLHQKGFRFKLHDSKLPGKPDIVLPKYKVIIMIHGCFWHGHDCHLFKWPSTRFDFWKLKIEGNRLKDTETKRKLTDLGWRILVVWECAIKGKGKRPLNQMLEIIADWVTQGSQFFEVRGYKC